MPLRLCEPHHGFPHRPLHVLVGMLLALMMPLAVTAAGVEGSVKLEAVHPLQPAAAYRTRTRTPVLPPDAARAIVWLEREDGQYPQGLPEPETHIAQEGYQFRPGITAVQKGSQVRFPNHDEEFHSVFSYSQTKRFDLGRYRKGEETPAVTFDKPGVVKIYCEIHKHMRSIVLVLESPWFVVTDEAGGYRLTGVPEGDYWLKAWLPTDRALEARVQLRGETPQRVNLGDP
jgi:plastocyanin